MKFFPELEEIQDGLPGWWIVDIETERLENPQQIWVLVAQELTSGASFKTYPHRGPEEVNRLKEWWKSVNGIIGHNWIHFDGPVIRSLTALEDKPCIDTLVISRLLNYNIDGKHSLDAWGERLGLPKLHFEDFDHWSPYMDLYCTRDVEVTKKLFEKFSEYLTSEAWYDSIYLEHYIATLCRDMEETGFCFDIEEAQSLITYLSSKLEILDKELQKAFPPRYIPVREVTPRVTKAGFLHKQDFRWWDSDDLSSFSPGVPFTIVKTKAFSPSSPKDIVSRLNALGWKPTDKTKGHLELLRDRRPDKERLTYFKEFGWRVSEENLATLPKDAPEAAQKLVERVTLASRLSDLEEWSALYEPGTGRVHGRFLHIGSWTGRMAHRGPNMANIPGVIEIHDNSSTLDKLKAPINAKLRALWGAPELGLLVGTDADGIQLRMFAHYCEDEEFTQSLLTGNKKDGTDPHSVNQRALGDICRTRDHAKTFIYSFLMGAGVAKLAEVLDCSLREAEQARENFLARYPRYAYIRGEYSEEVWSCGYFIGLDGRKVIPPSQHKLMSGLLQNGEAVLMKRANMIWRERLKKESVPFHQVNFVHDEWQTETVRDQGIARYIGEVQCDAIREAGEQLKLKCPMKGNFSIGRNWFETH